MVFYRKYGREKNDDELKEVQNFSDEYIALDNENLFIYAAQIENKFVGYISIAYIPKVGKNRHGYNGFLYIDELWTNPNYRRNGIAYALMMKADELCKEMNISGLRLYVGGSNPGALALYTKCGYRDRGNDAHFMDKILGK
jgi:ribosomal protein S18 acetylase RimI-like enzyme